MITQKRILELALDALNDEILFTDEHLRKANEVGDDVYASREENKLAFLEGEYEEVKAMLLKEMEVRK